MAKKVRKIFFRIPVRQFLGFLICLSILSIVVLQPGAAGQETLWSSAQNDLEPVNSDRLLASNTAAQDSSNPDITVDISRYDQNQVQFEVTFDVSSPTKDLVVSTPDVATDSRGFRYTSQEDSYRWDRRTNNPSITYVIDIRNWEDTNALGRDYASGSNWIFAPNPPISVSWISDSGQSYYWLPFTNPERGSVTINTPGPSVVGERSMYLGPYTEYSQMIGEQNVRLIVSDEVTLEDDPNEVVSALQDASQYMVGSIHSEILVFALPSPMREGGMAYPQSGEFWVHESARLDSPNNLWFHEYMHTRQTYETNQSMKWFREASAQYHAAALSFNQERISERVFLNYISNDKYNDEVLVDPETWSDNQVPYVKGPKVLYALDLELRKRTNGEQHLGNVIYRMHQQEGAISYTDFKSIVVELTGPEIGPWLDRYVTSSASPNIQNYTSATPQQTDSEPQSTAPGNNNDSGPDNDSFGGGPLNILIGGVVGYLVWKDSNDKDQQLRSFFPGVFVCLVFLANLILGVIAVSGYWYWTRY